MTEGHKSFALMVAFGVLIGVALMPFCTRRRDGGRESALFWLAAWSFFWPLLLIAAAREGVRLYIVAWRSYLSDLRRR